MRSRRDFILRAAAMGAALGIRQAYAAFSTDARSTPAPLRMLILGGTGFIGPHFVRAALDRGHEVAVFSRGRAGANLPSRVERLTGDRDGDLESIKNRDWDVVLDLAVYVPKWVRTLGLATQERVKHYIFISTVAAYEQPKGHERLHENSALSVYEGREDPFTLSRITGIDQYGSMKVLCEREAENQFSARALILRPGYIVGPDDPNAALPYWLLRLSKGGEVLAVNDEAASVQFIDVRDLAEWAIRLAERRVTGIYNAVGPARSTGFRDLIDTASSTVGTSSKVTWVTSEWLASQSDREMWRKLFFFSDAPDGYGWMMRMDNQRALANHLALRPMRDTLAYIFDHYRKLSESDQAKLVSFYKKKENGAEPELVSISWPTYLQRESELLRAWHAQRAAKE